jgi:hypothetical protein
MAHKSYVVTDRNKKSITSSVTINLDPQKDQHEVVIDLKDQIGAYADTADFHVGRPVADLVLTKRRPANAPASLPTPSQVVDPPARFGFEITPDDVARATSVGASAFKLAFYAGGRWHVVKEGIPVQAGPVSVDISKLGDPVYAVSP